jgi:acylglycerol lipase
MSAVVSSFVQDVDARAIGTHHLAILNIQEYAGMTEGTTIAGDRAVVDVIGFRGKSSAVRHFGPRSGGQPDGMIAMPRMRSTMLSLLMAAMLSLMACTSELEPPGPSVVTPTETGDTFVMPDGDRLPYRFWLPPGAPKRQPAVVVLALHGMNDSRDAWEIPGPELAAAGIAVYSPDQRGFGGTTTRGHWPGTKGLVDDARVMARLLHQRYPAARLYLMGESMGAAVLMVLATEPHAPKVAGYVLVSPAVWGRAEMNFFLRGLLWIASRTVPGLTLVNRGYVKITATDNHAALVRLSEDRLTIRETRVDATQGLVDLMDAALASAAKFQAPVLFVYGGKDELIPKQATLATWRALPEGASRLAYYPNDYHLAMRDLERATIVNDVVAWMNDPSAPLPSGADRAAAAWMRSEAVK